jgi:2-phosphosulfolactate phosphatase
MKSIEVSTTPEMVAMHEVAGKIVVVADIYRATSCTVAGLGTGVAEIRPVAQVEEAFTWQQQGYLAAGERNGIQVEGFDMGNSPFEFMRPEVKGRKIVMTTTNGTKAIHLSKGAGQIICGAFLNLGVTARYLVSQPRDLLVVCAGWKGRFSLEDHLYAGALVTKLQSLNSSLAMCDAAKACTSLYQSLGEGVEGFIQSSSHAERLRKIGVVEDLPYCLQQDVFPVIPVLDGDRLIPFYPM